MTSPEPRLTLMVTEGRWGLASASPFCLRSIALLVFSGVPFASSIVGGASPVSASGPAPCLRDAGESGDGEDAVTLSSFDATAQHVEQLAAGRGRLAVLNEAQKAEALAFESMVEDRLHVALLHQWFTIDDNYRGDSNVDGTRMIAPSQLPFPFSLFSPWTLRRSVEDHLLAHAPPPVQLLERADRCYAALAQRLGSAQWFFGTMPSRLDAVVFGHLALHYYPPLPSAPLRGLIDKYPNLVAFLARASAVVGDGDAALGVEGGVQQPSTGSTSNIRMPSFFARRENVARSAKDEALRRRCKTSLVFAGVAVVAFVLFTDFVPERVIDVMLEDE